MSENKEKDKEKEKETYEHTFKILLLGDSSVGKTCFLMRYIDNTFQDVYLSTIGFDFKYKIVSLNNGKKVRVQLWDTAGQERFRTIGKNYYKGAHGILLLYDVKNQKSFFNMKKWLTHIKEEAPKKVRIVIAANKIDIEPEKREVSEEEGESFAESFNLKFFECSAKEGININEAFQGLIEEINEHYEHYKKIDSQGKKLTDVDNTNSKKKCC